MLCGVSSVLLVIVLRGRVGVCGVLIVYVECVDCCRTGVSCASSFAALSVDPGYMYTRRRERELLVACSYNSYKKRNFSHSFRAISLTS